MAPRGRRPRKPRLTRMDAALDAMIPLGFSKEIVRRTVKDLLKEYGGDEGWPFIEGDAYKLLIDSILDEQEKLEEEEPTQEKSEDNSLQDGRASDNALADAVGPSNQDDSIQDGRACDNAIADAVGPSNQVLDDSFQDGRACENAIADAAGPSNQVLSLSCSEPMNTALLAVEIGQEEIDMEVSGSSDNKSEGKLQIESTQFHSPPPASSSPQPVNSLPTRMRKPCYGWISSDDEDVDDIVVLTRAIQFTPSTTHVQSENVTSGMDKRRKRKSRWDQRPEDL